MPDDRPGFYWRDREFDTSLDKRGPFTFEELRPFLELVAVLPDSYLIVSLPNVNLDFTAVIHGEIEMEIHDEHGMHVALVSAEQAKEVTQKAIQNCGTHILRGQLSDLDLDWLCTSSHYA